MKRWIMAFLTWGWSEVINFLVPKAKYENAKAQGLDAFQFPRSNEGDPVAFVHGRVRLKAPNTLWYGGFRTVPIKEKMPDGLFGEKKVTVGYRYFVTLNLALCLGPGVTLKRIWAGKDLIWEGSQSTIGDIVIDKANLYGGVKKRGGLSGTVTFYPGDFGQPRDALLATQADPDVPGYGGICHVVFKDFYWGTSANIPSLNFEVERHTNALATAWSVMPDGADSNPFEVLYDIMVSKWGRLGIDSALIDLPSWQSVTQQVYDEGYGMSLRVSGASTGKDVAEEVLRLVDGLLYQDPTTGKIVATLIREDYDVGVIPSFDQSNVKQVRNFTKELWSSTYNQTRVKFINRAADYADGAQPHQDFGNITNQGRVKTLEITLAGCYTAELAAKIAAREGSVVGVPLYKVSLSCNREAAALRPGQVIKLAWAPYGLVQMILRVQRISLGTLKDGTVSVECSQDTFASGLEVFASSPPSSWVPIDRIAPEILYRQLRELTYWELLTQLSDADFEAFADNQGMLGLAAVKPSDPSLDYLYKIRLNGAGAYEGLNYAAFTPSGKLTGAMGYLTTSFTLNSMIDTTDIELNTIVRIDNELMYLTAFNSLTGVGTVRRAVLDTVAAPHAIDARMWFLGSDSELADFVYDEGDSLQVKMMAHTDSDERDEAGVPIDTIVMAQRHFRPYPPSTLRINGLPYPTFVEASDITVTWNERNRLTQGATIVDEDDVTVSPEASTTYTLKYYEDGLLVETNVGLVATTDTFAPSGQCDLTVELYSVRDGLDSHQKHVYTFEYSPPVESLLQESGDNLLTEDGGRLLQE